MTRPASAALAEQVLPLIRTRAELYRWRASNAHGSQMHEAVDILEASMASTDPKDVYAVTTKAIASAMKVIARADDSSGIIGDACRRLLALHPATARAAHAPAAALVKWMVTFQFDGDVDYFNLDPVAYAPALGEIGLARYRKELSAVETKLGPRPSEDARWSNPHSHEWFVLGWNEQRLAVLDRDIDAIIRTHARDRRVAAWLQDTAEAFEEIGEIDLAIDWARQAADFDDGHQAKRAADYLADLLAAHRPAELLPERLEAFRRWPTSSTAAQLHGVAADAWPEYASEVNARLAPLPRDAVLFTLLTLKDLPRAWQLAHELQLADTDAWSRLAMAYEKVDALAVLPVLEQLARGDLVEANAKGYRAAAVRLDRMRAIATGTGHAGEVDELIAELRQANRHRPRLQQEFDRVGLPPLRVQ
jgi:tetratricopeptide (TPR) repeat protein